MRKVWFLVVFVVLCGLTAQAEEVCLTGLSAIALANDIKQCKQLREISALQTEALKKDEERLSVLEKIAENSEKVIKLKDEQISLQDKVIKNYGIIVDTQTETIAKLQKATKPSIFERLQTMSIGAVVGAIAIGLLML